MIFSNIIFTRRNVKMALTRPITVNRPKCRIFPIDFLLESYMKSFSFWSRYENSRPQLDPVLLSFPITNILFLHLHSLAACHAPLRPLRACGAASIAFFMGIASASKQSERERDVMETGNLHFGSHYAQMQINYVIADCRLPIPVCSPSYSCFGSYSFQHTHTHSLFQRNHLCLS